MCAGTRFRLNLVENHGFTTHENKTATDCMKRMLLESDWTMLICPVSPRGTPLFALRFAGPGTVNVARTV